MSNFICKLCRRDLPMAVNNQRAFGEMPGGARVCPECLGRIDAVDMAMKGVAALWLVIVDDSKPEDDRARYEVRNYFGTLRFPIMRYNKGKHNIADVQQTVDFIGPDEGEWYGRVVGDTQVVHCRRKIGSPHKPDAIVDEKYFHKFYA